MVCGCAIAAESPSARTEQLRHSPRWKDGAEPGALFICVCGGGDPSNPSFLLCFYDLVEWQKCLASGLAVFPLSKLSRILMCYMSLLSTLHCWKTSRPS